MTEVTSHEIQTALARLGKMTEVTSQKIQATLARLGKRPSTVANRLKKLGIKGRRQSADQCPVAQFVSQELGTDCCVDEEECFVSFPYRMARTPPGVSTFIKDFDNGKYPDLEEGK